MIACFRCDFTLYWCWRHSASISRGTDSASLGLFKFVEDPAAEDPGICGDEVGATSGDLCKAGKVPTQSHGDCGGSGGHGSSGVVVPLKTSGHPPQGRPTQGLASTVSPKDTFLTWQASASTPHWCPFRCRLDVPVFEFVVCIRR